MCLDEITGVTRWLNLFSLKIKRAELSADSRGRKDKTSRAALLLQRKGLFVTSAEAL